MHAWSYCSTRGYIQEYMGSLSLLRNDLVGPSCDLLKVIPGERLLDSSVLHYYHSTDHLLLRTSHPLYGTHEHIVTGEGLYYSMSSIHPSMSIHTPVDFIHVTFNHSSLSASIQSMSIIQYDVQATSSQRLR